MKEEELDRLLRSRERRLPLAPFAEVERRLARGRLWPLVPAIAVVGAIVIGLVAGLALPDLRQRVGQQSASPSPATAAATGQPPGAVLDARFAFASWRDGEIAIRRETGGAPLRVLDGAAGMPAASPDGRYLAYWRRDGERYELRLYDAVEDQLGPAAFALPSGEQPTSPSSLIWSSDGSGLLLAGITSGFRQGRPTSPADHTSLYLYDRASGRTALLRLLAGKIAEPLAWSRQTASVAARVDGEGSLVIDERTAQSAQEQAAPIFGVDWTARYVVTLETCTPNPPCRVFRVRELRTFALVHEVPHQFIAVPGVRFRPFSLDLYVAGESAPNTDRLDLLADAGRGSRITLGDAQRTTEVVPMLVPRADGSAAFLLEANNSRTAWRALLATPSSGPNTVDLEGRLAPVVSLVLDRTIAHDLAARVRAVLPVAGNSGVLEVDGWQFTVSVVKDPAYGPQPSAGAWAISEVAGVGVRCAWTRTGPDTGAVEDQWGIPERVVSTAGYSGRTGASGDRQNGIPEGAVRGNVATMVCGLRDSAGAHGVVIDLTIPSAGHDASIRLSRWSGSLRPPQCPGQLPQLTVTHPPPPGDQPGTGAPNAEEAFRRAYPAITDFTMYPFGTDQPTRDPQLIKQGPAWIVAGTDAFIAQYIGPFGLNSWFAHPAKFVRCMDSPSRPSPTPAVTPADCSSVVEAVVPPTATLYPTRTAAEVTSGLKNDPSFRHTLEDIAGVRQDANPLRDRGVPRCAVDALTTGDPVFVRRYPSDAGVWYVPVNYPDRQVLLVTVSRSEGGLGASGGSIGGGGDPGGAFPPMIRAKALQVGGTSTDAAVSAELVFARAYGSGPEMIAWRVVRASGAVFYVFPSYPGAGADGLLLPEPEVSLGS